MRLASLLCILLLSAAPAIADTGVTEIHLGTPPPPEQEVDRAKVNAVERLLAARQAGSIDRDRAPEARLLFRTKERLDDAAVFGPKGSSLAAFNFHDESIASEGAGRFSVSVFLLFSNEVGQVVESRDEELIFSHEGDGYACTALHATNVIAWSQDGVREAAAALGATQELEQAERYLVGGSAGKDKRSSFSMADIEKSADGKVVVQCLRFRSDPGKRGFDVSTNPVVLSRVNDSIRVESN